MASSAALRSFEVSRSRLPVGPGRSSFDPAVIDFGHYAGAKLIELADADPDYLRWLERVPVGARYRAEIRRVLTPQPLLHVCEH